ncbi:MAG: hypothetical protein Q9220_002454 [cf. Caloplaca sp. 1 TL-2023]
MNEKSDAATQIATAKTSPILKFFTSKVAAVFALRFLKKSRPYAPECSPEKSHREEKKSAESDAEVQKQMRKEEQIRDIQQRYENGHGSCCHAGQMAVGGSIAVVIGRERERIRSSRQSVEEW